MSTATITLVNDGPVFPLHTPKPEGINALKLTENNLDHVVAHIRKTSGKAVTISDGEITVGLRSLRVDTWIVEEYNYATGVNDFRTAVLSERIQFDLR